MADPPVDADAFNAFEAAGWEERAGGYADYFAAISARLAEPVLDAADVRPGTRLLDAASGPGFMAAAAAARGAQVVGVDVAHAMVALARERHPELEFRHGDAEALPFPDAAFDAVVGNLLLLHLGRPEQGAAELARVLAPGGRLALTVWDLPERARILGVMLEALAEAGAATPADIPVGPPFFRFADDAEFAGLLAGAGLEDVAIETIAFAHPVPSAEAAWHGLIGGSVRTSALVLRQTADVQQEIRAAFDRIVRQHAGRGRIDLPISVKLGSGRRPGA